MIFAKDNRLTIAVALGVLCVAGLWLWTSSGPAVPSYVFIGLVAVAMVLVGLNTWNNGQATGSMAQIIHDADATQSKEPASTTVDRG
jgi:hypothetical protein